MPPACGAWKTPLLAPVAHKLGIDMVWFGVLLAVNMQTSFMHPPFGFALFYLRSVAPTEDYKDRITGKQIAKVTTGQIYWGAVPFVIIQTLAGIVSSMIFCAALKCACACASSGAQACERRG